MAIRYILSVAAGYFIGSVSFSILITKKLLKNDVRNMGSGNAGATNVARVFGFGVGIATFAGDVLKTVVAMLLGEYLGGEIGKVLSAAACIIGHSWPVYYGFKGGKGVSVGAAIALMLDWRVLVVISIAFFIVALTTKIVSLASITAAVSLPVSLYLLGDRSAPVLILGIFAGLYVIFLHRSNISRLIAGTEPKFKAKSAKNVSKDEYGGKK